MSLLERSQILQRDAQAIARQVNAPQLPRLFDASRPGMQFPVTITVDLSKRLPMESTDWLLAVDQLIHRILASRKNGHG